MATSLFTPGESYIYKADPERKTYNGFFTPGKSYYFFSSDVYEGSVWYTIQDDEAPTEKMACRWSQDYCRLHFEPKSGTETIGEAVIKKTLARIKEENPGADIEKIGVLLHEAMAEIIDRINEAEDRRMFSPEPIGMIDIPLNGEHIEFDPGVDPSEIYRRMREWERLEISVYGGSKASGRPVNAAEKKFDRGDLHFAFSKEAAARMKKLEELNEVLNINGFGSAEHMGSLSRLFNSTGPHMDIKRVSQELNKLTLVGKRETPKPAKRKQPYPVPKKKRGKKKH